MTDPGARQEAWHHFSELLGLTADLLPVVSDPDVTISPDSRMQAIGKTPSVINFRGHAAGFPKWTEHVATPRDIAKWSLEPRYGISIQCRTIRAIDIDVPHKIIARRIAKRLRTILPLVRFPERYRETTGKTLFAFRYAGSMPKRVIPVEGGMIEFLGDGQQFIAAGRHPDGSRYEWRAGLPLDIPEISAVDLEWLWDNLVLEFATGEPKIARVRRDPATSGELGWTGGADKVADYLVENGHVLDQDRDGRLYIECPFAVEHTSDSGPTSTAYFPAGTGGYERGHFACLHAHCTDRADQDFREAIGYEASTFPLIEDETTTADEPGRELVKPKGEVQIKRDFPNFLRDKAGQIEPTTDNLVKGCERSDFIGRHIAFDNFTFGIMWAPWVEGEPASELQWRAWADHDYVDLKIALERRGFKNFGAEVMRGVVNKVARQHAIDTAQEWLNRIEWDGVSRVNAFMVDMLGCLDTPYARAIGHYLWTALAGRVMEPGVKADMVVALKGPQGTGKSSAIEALVPVEDFFVEISLSHRDEDTSRRLRGKLVAEIAELRGLRSRDSEDVKAFITRRKESWIPKYYEMEATFMRRLVFLASTNQDTFLADPSGERRWLPIEAGLAQPIRVDLIRENCEQLWAEGATMFMAEGVAYRDAELLAPAEHVKFKDVDVWLPKVARWLASPGAFEGEEAPCQRPYEWGIADVLEQAIGLKAAQIGRAQEIRIGNILGQLGAIKKRVWNEGWCYAIDAENVANWRV